MSREDEREAVARANRRRPGRRGGVYGVTYWTGGYYLNPQQFNFTTAQEPVNGFGGGQMSTATPGAGGGDGGGGAAGGGAA